MAVAVCLPLALLGPTVAVAVVVGAGLGYVPAGEYAVAEAGDAVL